VAVHALGEESKLLVDGPVEYERGGQAAQAALQEASAGLDGVVGMCLVHDHRLGLGSVP
jgi:hypothetical protein